MEKMIANEGHLAFEARVELQRAGADALAARGVFHVAVPGGSVAKLFFPAFADAALDWARVHVWWVDERVVPLTNADSNYKPANELWLSKVPAHVHPFVDVNEYQKTLPMPLDLAILGVGPDGHIASLFPGHPGLERTEKRAFTVMDSPKPPSQRVTLSLNEICAAREVWIVATGAAKAQAMADAHQPDSPLPVARVMREAKGARLWLDPAAGAQL